MNCEICQKELRSEDHRFNHLYSVHKLRQRDLGCRWCGRKDVNLHTHTAWCESNPSVEENRSRRRLNQKTRDYSVFRTTEYRDKASLRRSKILSGESRDYQHKFFGRIEYYTVKCGFSEVKVLGTWERDFTRYLNESEVEWIRPGPLIWKDSSLQKRRYTPDFWLPKYQVYVEVKGYLSEYDEDKMERAATQNNTIIKLLRSKEIESIQKGTFSLDLENLPQYPNWQRDTV